MARELADLEGFSLLCGRYEGVDDRVRQHLVDDELSIGDYVLGGGEVAAMVVLEAVGRLVPGVMGNDGSADDESFSDGLLEYPQFTRPAELPATGSSRRCCDPATTAAVERWRRAQALARTIERRPDLIEARGGLDDRDRALLAEFGLGGDLTGCDAQLDGARRAHRLFGLAGEPLSSLRCAGGPIPPPTLPRSPAPNHGRCSRHRCGAHARPAPRRPT